MTIGEKIKQLRKQQDVTQEKLADYLNISYQAVSKWENGGAMPDITLVVPIANFFGVSTDTLFDMNAQIENEEIKEIERIGQELANKGLMREELEHWRKAAEKYPRNYSFLGTYASCLDMASYSPDFQNEPDKEKYVNEAISVSLRILEDCTDSNIRAGAIQTLVFAYASLKQHDKATEYAEKASNIHLSREMLLEHAYAYGDEKWKKQKHDNIKMFVDLLATKIQYMKYNSNEDEIFALETAVKLYHTIFYDGNFLFIHCRLTKLYENLALVYAYKKDKEKTFEHLELAKKHAVLYDNLPEGKQNYTGIFLNLTEFDKSGTTKNYSCTSAELLKERITLEPFEFIRNDERFVKFIESF